VEDICRRRVIGVENSGSSALRAFTRDGQDLLSPDRGVGLRGRGVEGQCKKPRVNAASSRLCSYLSCRPPPNRVGYAHCDVLSAVSLRFS
jgi:hypothetical protein